MTQATELSPGTSKLKDVGATYTARAHLPMQASCGDSGRTNPYPRLVSVPTVSGRHSPVGQKRIRVLRTCLGS